MLHEIDFASPVYWLLAAGALGAATLFVLGLVSVLNFDRKYNTRDLQRQARCASAVGDFGPLERVIFVLFPLTVLLLGAYVLLGFIFGVPLI